MIAQISLAKAELLALFLESILYGVFLTLYIVTMWVASGRRDRRNYKWVVSVATVMAIFATVHLIIDFVRIVQAFVLLVNEYKDGANGYYAELYNPLHVAKTVIYVTQTVMGDAVMIWRLYVVYNRTFFVLIPMTIVLLGNAAVGYVVAWSLSQAKPGVNIFETAESFITSFFVLTMFINITATIGIAYRIISHNLRNANLKLITTKTGNLLPVAIIIVESGAIYASSVLALLISFSVGSNGQYPALDVVTPLVGTVFCLIILQIHFHLNSEHKLTTTVGNNTSNGSGYPLQSLSVHIDRTHVIDSDDSTFHGGHDSDIDKPKPGNDL